VIHDASTPGSSPPPASAPSAPGTALPRRIPLQIWRETQSNIPAERADRNRVKAAAAQFVRERGLVPPISMADLRAFSKELCASAGFDERYADYTAVLLNNESWRDELARVPFERRLLLIPKCLRVEEHCPAPFDEFGLLCKECGLCSIEDFTAEAERLGYAVLVAEGSAIVRGMIETGKIEAIVGVSCLNVLEKCFPHMEAVAIPGISIPLLQDDCVNTNVDTDQVWDVIHLTSDDQTYRLDLDGLKSEVQGWFAPAELGRIMGPAQGVADEVAREWVQRDGKRWRPYLSACVHMALSCEGVEERPQTPAGLMKLAAAVECFHKASLVHDDIEDGDDERYGQRALHAEHGVPVALNAGDLLLGEGYRLISEVDVDGPLLGKMLSEAARGHVSLARGQGAELSWANDPRPLSSLEVLDIFRQKTAPAFEVALRLGALYAGADEDTHEVLSAYSESLGIAYQIRDDLEDFSGDGDSNDLADLRPSLILAIAHKRAAEGEDRELIGRLWRRELDYHEAEEDVLRILAQGGVIQKARELRDAYEQQAVDCLRPLSNATLKGLLRRVIGKIFGDKHLIEGYCTQFEEQQMQLPEQKKQSEDQDESEARNAAGGALGAQPAG